MDEISYPCPGDYLLFLLMKESLEFCSRQVIIPMIGYCLSPPEAPFTNLAKF